VPRKSRFQEQSENKLRVETISKLFSAATMTVATVVVVSVFVPQSPRATLEDVIVFEDRVSYRVNIVDPDQAIQNDSLLVRLSNQLELYETTLQFGYSLGAFDNLNTGTSYFLEVVADKGFGLERLASKRIKTLARDGGLIASVDVLEATEQGAIPFEVTTVYYNRQETYTAFSLEYASVYQDIYEESSSSMEPQPLVYTPIELIASPSTTIIDIPSYHAEVHFRLLGYTSLTEYVILDEAVTPMPFRFEAYAYLKQVSTRSVSAYVYPSYMLDGAVYTAELYRGSRKMDTKEVTIPSTGQNEYEQQAVVSFTSLLPSTDYTIRFYGDYVNPQTLRQEITMFSEYEVTTLGTYSYQYDYIEDDTSIQATITLIDPNHNFQSFFYEIYEEGAAYPYPTGQNGFLSPENKTSTLNIVKPDYPAYRIVIGVRNNTDYYKYDVIDTPFFS